MLSGITDVSAGGRSAGGGKAKATGFFACRSLAQRFHDAPPHVLFASSETYRILRPQAGCNVIILRLVFSSPPRKGCQISRGYDVIFAFLRCRFGRAVNGPFSPSFGHGIFCRRTVTSVENSKDNSYAFWKKILRTTFVGLWEFVQIMKPDLWNHRGCFFFFRK